jgi:hypothetical protein
MADWWNEHAWELVRALAAIEPPLRPTEALQILDEMREQAVTLLAAQDGHIALSQRHRVSLVGAAPAEARNEPADDVEWDLPPYGSMPRD